jgi:hypothetical protein
MTLTQSADVMLRIYCNLPYNCEIATADQLHSSALLCAVLCTDSSNYVYV